MSLVPTPTRRNRLLDGDLIPMINVVFLLLIFFMAASRIAPREPGLELPLSSAAAALDEAGIDIVIGPAGGLRVNGVAVAAGSSGTVPAALATRLRQLAVGPRSEVVLRVHRGLPARVLDPVLGRLREHGVARVQIAVQRLP